MGNGQTAKHDAAIQSCETTLFSEGNDSWCGEYFEDQLETAIIACYENKIKHRNDKKNQVITPKDLYKVRRFGLFIPHPSRKTIVVNDESVHGFYDVKNDTTPNMGCVSFYSKGAYDEFGMYQVTCYFERINSPKISGADPAERFLPIDKGSHYIAYWMGSTDSGVIGKKFRFTITDDGNIKVFDTISKIIDKTTGKKKYVSLYSTINENQNAWDWVKSRSDVASDATQIWADRKYCWQIMAKQGISTVTLGCTREEIKSLLYARDLPLTATGRKRPILHLVESHRRRIKSGTEVDISSFLRGVAEVKIGDTGFKVLPQVSISGTLSKNSQRYYS